MHHFPHFQNDGGYYHEIGPLELWNGSVLPDRTKVDKGSEKTLCIFQVTCK